MLPKPFELPADTREGDWIEIEQTGAYSNALASHFNGFHPETFVEIAPGRKERMILRGAVATSSTRQRRWQDASGRPQHHLIDPRTGRPADSGLSQVTVHGAEAWMAEVLAKAVLIGGVRALDLPGRNGYSVLAAF